MMIQTFQRFSQSPIAKAFLIVVALSFGAFFGGSQFFGSRSQVVAEVGDISISAREFSLALEQQRRSFESLTGQSVSLEQMAQSGLVVSILNGLIAKALLDQEAKNLGLAVTDFDVLEALHQQKVFQNENGEFDRNLFDRILYSNRMTEDAYIEEIRGELSRQQLEGAVVAGAFVPKLLSKALLESQFQVRQGATVTLKAENMSMPASPGDEALEAFYTEHQDAFMQPEARSFAAMIISPEMVSGEIEVSENDLRAEYDATKDDYDNKPFDEVKEQVKKNLIKHFSRDKLYELSQQIEDELAGGSSLEEIAKNYKLLAFEEVTFSGEGVDGKKVKTTGVDEDVRGQIFAEAFQTEEGAESQFTETSTGEYFIVRVDKIQPEQPLPFEEIKDRVYKEWAYTAQMEEAYKNAEAIANGINSGSSMPGTLKLLPNISLSNPDQSVPGEIVSVLYSLSPGKASLAPSEDGVVVVMLKNIISPSPQVQNAEREKLEKEATKLMQDDLLQAYVDSLRIRYPVSINWDMVRAILGNGE